MLGVRHPCKHIQSQVHKEFWRHVEQTRAAAGVEGGDPGGPCFLPPQRDFRGGMSGQLAHNEGGSSMAAVWRHDGIIGLETEAEDRTEALLHMTGWISRGGCLAASLPYSHRLHGSGTPQRGLCNFRQCVCVPRSDSFAVAASREGWCLSGGENLCWHNVWYTFLCSEGFY